jgi:hypothetical protein
MEAATDLDALDTKAGVLAAARAARTAEIVATADQLRAAVAWADHHPAESLDDAAAVGVIGDTVFPIAGPGAPWVTEFCIAEFAAALGLPTDHGRWLMGEALELRHRLPRLWRRVMTHDLPAWRARRIARKTMELTPEAAAFVDAHIAHLAHKAGPVIVDRLIDEAIARHMPATATEHAARAADQRRFVVDHRQVSFTGTTKVYGELDLADALDLDAAITARAAHLAALGSDLHLDARRAAAAGELARADLTLDLTTGATDITTPVPDTHTDTGTAGTGTAGTGTGRRRGSRETVLYVHLSSDALTGRSAGLVGRVENTGDLVTADQIRSWCAAPFAKVTVKPVIDLDAHVHVGSYEVPDRLAEQVALRDATCVFPWCSRPARRCDKDHVVPYDARAAGRGEPAGGEGLTCSCNLAPLCRRHHRLKTHGRGWSYTSLDPGTYLWSTPHGYQFLRDHTGTTDVTRDPPRAPAGPD